MTRDPDEPPPGFDEDDDDDPRIPGIEPDVLDALVARLRGVARAGGVGKLVNPLRLIREAAADLGGAGIALLLRDRGLRVLVTRFAYWGVLRDPTVPALDRAELASQLEHAASEIARQRELLLEGCWLENTRLHPWLFRRVGSCLGIPWVERGFAPEEIDCGDEGTMLVDIKQLRINPHELLPPARKALRPREPSNPTLDAARADLAGMSLELLGRLAEDVGAAADRVDDHVTDVLVGARARSRDPRVVHFAMVEEAHLNGNALIALEGPIRSPGPRALLSVAAHCQFEIRNSAFGIAARIAKEAPVASDQTFFALLSHPNGASTLQALDEFAAKLGRMESVRRKFVSRVNPLLEQAQSGPQPESPRGGGLKEPHGSRRVAPRTSPPRASQTAAYDVPDGTRWHQIVIELGHDRAKLGVLLGKRRLPVMTPATLGMLDGRRGRLEPTPAWATFVALLAVQSSRGARRAPRVEDRATIRQRIARIRAALKASFPSISADEDPLPYVAGEGWVPGFTLHDVRDHV